MRYLSDEGMCVYALAAVNQGYGLRKRGREKSTALVLAIKMIIAASSAEDAGKVLSLEFAGR